MFLLIYLFDRREFLILHLFLRDFAFCVLYSYLRLIHRHELTILHYRRYRIMKACHKCNHTSITGCYILLLNCCLLYVSLNTLLVQVLYQPTFPTLRWLTLFFLLFVFALWLAKNNFNYNRRNQLNCGVLNDYVLNFDPNLLSFTVLNKVK